MRLFTAPDPNTGRPLLFCTWEGIPDSGDFSPTGVSFSFSYELSTTQDFSVIIESGSGVNSSNRFIAFNNSLISRDPNALEDGFGFGRRFFFKLWVVNYQSETFGFQSLPSTSVRPARLGIDPYTPGFSIAYGHPAAVLVKRGALSWRLIPDEPSQPVRRRFLR